jgi:hypothetical protein
VADRQWTQTGREALVNADSSKPSGGRHPQESIHYTGIRKAGESWQEGRLVRRAEIPVGRQEIPVGRQFIGRQTKGRQAKRRQAAGRQVPGRKQNT